MMSRKSSRIVKKVLAMQPDEYVKPDLRMRCAVLKKRKNGSRGKPQVFPSKVFKILEQGDMNISWDAGGDSFTILHPVEFIREHTSHGKLESFQRQLNLYGFHKVSKSDTLQYRHPCFKRGRGDLVQLISRSVSPYEMVDEVPREVTGNVPYEVTGEVPYEVTGQVPDEVPDAVEEDSVELISASSLLEPVFDPSAFLPEPFTPPQERVQRLFANETPLTPIDYDAKSIHLILR